MGEKRDPATLARGLSTQLMTPAGRRAAFALVDELPLNAIEAWEACIARGLLPESWAGNPRRRFHEQCGLCRGRGWFDEVPNEEDEDEACDNCAGLGVVACIEDPLMPSDTATVATLAQSARDAATVEALATEAAQAMQWPSHTLHWYGVGDDDVIDDGDGWTFGGSYANSLGNVNFTLGRNITPGGRPDTRAVTPRRQRLNAMIAGVKAEALLRYRSPLPRAAMYPAFRDLLHMLLAPASSQAERFYRPLVHIWQLGFGVLPLERAAHGKQGSEPGGPILLLLAPKAEGLL